MEESFIAFIPGCIKNTVLSTTVYQPSTNTYKKRLPDLPKERVEAAACVLNNGDIMVCGGRRTMWKLKRDTWIYSRLTKEWKTSGRLRKSQAGHVLIVLEDGDVLSVGWGDHPLIERWNCRTEKWTIWKQNQILLKGGNITQLDGDRVLLVRDKSNLIYRISSDTWQPIEPSTRSWWLSKGCLLSDGRVLISGYEDGDDTIDIYDFNTASWTMGPHMPDRRGNFRLVSVEDKVYMFGERSLHIYNLITETWTQTPLPFRMQAIHGSAVVLYYDTNHYTETLKWKMLRFITQKEKEQSPIQERQKRQRTE